MSREKTINFGRLTPLLILLSIAVTILFAYEVAFIGLLLGFHLSPVEGSILVLGMLYLLIILGPWIREYMGEAQIILLAIALFMPFAMGAYYYPWCFMNQLIGARLLQPEIYNNLLPSLWAPPAELLKQALGGGAPTPWGAWAPSVVYWYIFTIANILLMFSLAGIVKERWNEIEKLSYPHAIALNRIVEFSLGREQKYSWIFHAGIVIGFLAYLPWVLHQVLPWFPNIYGWNQPPFRYGMPTLFDLVVFSPAVKQGYAGVLTFQTSPVEAAFYFLVPLDVLFTAWISWLIFLVILPHVAYIMGYYPNMPALADSIARYDIIGRQDPLKLHALAGVGIFIGVFLWPILLNWRWYVGTIKKALKSSPVKELREGKPSYSFFYTLLFVSYLVLVVLMTITGANILAAAWLFLAVIIHSLAMARQSAEAGVSFTGGWWGTLQALTYHVLYPGMSFKTMDRSYFEVQLMAHSLIVSPASSLTSGPLYYSLLAYKIGEDKGLNSLNIFKTLTLTTLVSALVAIPLVIWSWYTIGYNKIPISVDGWWWPDRWTNPSLISPYPSEPPWLAHALAGLGLSGLVFYLRMKYYWFPLNGIGLLFGILGGAWGHAFPAFIAWLFKYIVVKLGGATAYEKYGVSFAAGFFLGYIFSAFILGLGMVYRFLFPY